VLNFINIRALSLDSAMLTEVVNSFLVILSICNSLVNTKESSIYYLISTNFATIKFGDFGLESPNYLICFIHRQIKCSPNLRYGLLHSQARLFIRNRSEIFAKNIKETPVLPEEANRN